MADRARGWCLTINNPTEDDEAKAFSLQFDESIKYLVFGQEVGEQGTHHLQGFVYFNNPVRFSTVTELFDGRAHIEKMRGTVKQAADYCKKDGQFWEHGVAPMSQSEKGEAGKQSIAERWELAKEGRFEELPPEQIKTYQYIHSKYSAVVDRDTLDNIWIHGPSGCGKSRFVRENYPVHYWKGMSKWWDGYDQEDVAVLDDMDPKHGEFLGYYLKIWADHYRFNAEVKGGMLRIRPKTLIVTSQYPIEAVFPDFETCSAIKRRFKVFSFNQVTGTFEDSTGAPLPNMVEHFNPPPGPEDPMDWEDLFEILGQEPEPPADWVMYDENGDEL